MDFHSAGGMEHQCNGKRADGLISIVNEYRNTNFMENLHGINTAEYFKRVCFLIHTESQAAFSNSSTFWQADLKRCGFSENHKTNLTRRDFLSFCILLGDLGERNWRCTETAKDNDIFQIYLLCPWQSIQWWWSGNHQCIPMFGAVHLFQ